MIKILVSFLILFSSSVQTCWASACCARSAAAPTLILGEDEAQFGVGAAWASVVATANSEGFAIFDSFATSEVIQTYRLDGAILLSDRFQVGASVSLVRHRVTQNYLEDSTTDIGDSRFSFAYEFLPLWTYSSWKPQGLLFSVVTLPSGRSVHEAKKSSNSDVVGNGFFSVSAGAIFLKRWGFGDVFIMPELHYSLPRFFKFGNQDLQVVPGFGGSLGIGGGVSPGGGNLRAGLRIQPRLDQRRSIPVIDSKNERDAWVANCDVSVDMSYLLSSNDTLMFSYTDQTLLGPAMNSNLNQIFGVNFQHRWER